MIKPNAVWFVQTGPLLANVSERVFADHSYVDLIRKGSYLYFPDEARDYVYRVKGGRLRGTKFAETGEEETLAVLTEGDLFGELGPDAGVLPEFILEAAEDLVIRTIERSFFHQVIEKSPGLALRAVLATESSRYEVTMPLSQLIETPPIKRLSRLILRLADEFGVPLLDGRIVIPLKISSDAVTRLTGLSESAVTEVLTRLIQEHLIDVAGRMIYVRNRKELEKQQ
ncbi:MAG: Crp/Fnr family transcriptional regulator [candidate division WOR-3 bacterium]